MRRLAPCREPVKRSEKKNVRLTIGARCCRRMSMTPSALSSHLSALIGAARLPTAEVERRAGVPVGTIQRRIKAGDCGPREHVRVLRGLGQVIRFEDIFPGGPWAMAEWLTAGDGEPVGASDPVGEIMEVCNDMSVEAPARVAPILTASGRSRSGIRTVVVWELR